MTNFDAIHYFMYLCVNHVRDDHFMRHSQINEDVANHDSHSFLGMFILQQSSEVNPNDDVPNVDDDDFIVLQTLDILTYLSKD